MSTASFAVAAAEARKIRKIAARAFGLADRQREMIEIEMDLTATHCNGCPLDFDRLLTAGDFDFVHDILGIARHLNRETGQLMHCFVPRCAKPE